MTTKRLKVFQAHLGFYDTIVAAPSQKAALAAWGAAPGEFAKGFASIATDATAVAQALAEPGKVLKRPAGSKGAYTGEPARVALPKIAPPHRARMARKDKLRKQRDSERKAAERDVEKAKQQELREMMRLRKREAELEAEKAMLREKTNRRIARAHAKIAGASRR